MNKYKVESDKLLQSQYTHLLNDDELLTAIMYCRKLIRRDDAVAKQEFIDLGKFFFQNDTHAAMETLKKVDREYQLEYFKRHKN